MRGRNLGWLLAILALVVVAVLIDLVPNDPQYEGGDKSKPFTVDILGTKFDWRVKQGLDLQGGTQVLLEATEKNVTQTQMDGAIGVISQRINQGLSVNEPIIQQQGSNRILVELPGIKDPDAAIKTFGSTGRLEFIDTGTVYLAVGTNAQTSFPNTLVTPDTSKGYKVGAPVTPNGTVGGATTPGATTAPAAANSTAATTPTGTVNSATGTTPGAGTPAATASGTSAAGTTTPGTAAASTTSGATTTPTDDSKAQTNFSNKVYQTIMVGGDLDASKTQVGQNSTTGQYEIDFGVKGGADQVFLKHTSANIGKYMSITLDGKVISSAVINGAISNQGQISGSFTLNEAQGIVTQLKYGALPVTLKPATTSIVSATLGQDSVNRSITAGLVGLSIVAIFMLLYYRVPGLLADLALIIYTVLSFALYKLLGITLTLAGIAGFILSIGMAVDANVLIFARLKEELRLGRRLIDSIQAGFEHAWPSIRDSNISTMITTFILYWFGDFTGTSVIKGFALTLFLGVVVSLFTAVTVTRLLMRVMVSVTNIRNRWWYGMNNAHVATVTRAEEREKVRV